MDIKETVQRQFGSVAEQYAVSPVHMGGPDLTALVAAVVESGAKQVLDLGCGTGHTALALAAHVPSVTAVDLTEEMLTQGRKLAEARGERNVTFVRGDAERLDFPDRSFDLVTSRFSAHHYPHPARALSEVVRVLRANGTFLLVDVVAPLTPEHDTFLNAIELLRDPSHVRDYRVTEWLAMLNESGLSPKTLGTWRLHLSFEPWVTRMQTPDVAVAAIRYLLDGAPEETRAEFAVERDHSFSVKTVLLRGYIWEG